MSWDEKLASLFMCFIFTFLIYIFFRFTGHVPGKGMLNGIDFVMVRLLFFTLIATPIISIFYGFYLYILDLIDSEDIDVTKKLNL